MPSPNAYLPMDRRQALAQGKTLPDRAQGTALFADISGFTPLTTTLLKELGLKRGPEELTRQLNLVYDALVSQVHLYGGSVITFAGDAITCWFNDDTGERATTCGLAMQAAMANFAVIYSPLGTPLSLAMKVAVSYGEVRRFTVGNPQIQYLDVLAGSTLDHMAAGESVAQKGEVLVDSTIAAHLATQANWGDKRVTVEGGFEFWVVQHMTSPSPAMPWPQEVDLPAELVRPWILRPIYDRLGGGQSEFLAEVRPITSLFMRFSGIDYDNEATAGQKLDAYICWVQSIINRHEGNLLQLILGDKGCYSLICFGAPIAHENDAARAVATALELQHPPRELDFIGPIKIGISHGRAWVGPCGSATRHIYTVMGDEVNMAARLMGKAEPGQIMVSDVVADAVGDIYRLGHLGKIQVKGKAEPIGVALVLGRHRSGQPKELNPFPNVLVDREAELEQLANILERCLRTGQGQIIGLEGVTGIGKSHLLSEFANHALLMAWRIVWGYCHSVDENSPYSPYKDILRNMLVLTDEISPEAQITQISHIITAMNPDWAERLPLLRDLLDLEIPDTVTTASFAPHLRQEALFALVVDLFAQWSYDQPLLIIIEDIHWLDEASSHLTMALSRVITTMPVVLLMAQRPDNDLPVLADLHKITNYNKIILNELLPSGVASMIAHHLLVGQAAPLVVSFVLHQTKGNPLFVEELVNTLREFKHIIPLSESALTQLSEQTRSDIIWTLSETVMNILHQANCLLKDETGQWQLNPEATLPSAALGLPNSVHQLVLARFDRLADDYKLTLKVASVIGRFFKVVLLSAAHPLHLDPLALVQQFNDIEAWEFVYLETPSPNLVYAFRHSMTREVAYDTLLETQQRQLHQAVAESLEQLSPDLIELLAYHYHRAQIQPKAVFYLGQAAQNAQRAYANETALAYYEQILSLEENWLWRKGQIEVLHWLGRRNEQKAALELLAANSAAPAFEAAYLWGEYYEAISDYPAAQQAIQQALTTAPDKAAQARCLTQFGAIAHKQGDYEAAKSWYQQALALWEISLPHLAPSSQDYSLTEAKIITEALNGLGVIHRQQSAFEAARTCHEYALALSQRLGDLSGEARALSDLGGTFFYYRYFVDALAYHQRALTLRRTIGDRAGQGKSLYNAAMVTRDIGDYEQAKLYLNDALKILQATGNQWDEVNVWNELGILHQELGDLIHAQQSTEQALKLCKEVGDDIGEIYILGNLGIIIQDTNNLESARKYFTEGLILAQKQGDDYVISLFMSHIAIVDLLTNNLDQARNQAHQALTMRREQNLELWTTADLATLAAAYLGLGQQAEARQYAEEALALLDNCQGQGPETPQRDYYVVFEVFNQLGEIETATRALQAAYTLIQGKAEKIIDEVLRHSFLTNVPINQQVITAWENKTAGEKPA